ncbi:MAG: hypothetical protein JSV12_04490 [Candidatus Bathyarchaeota archaeon]|nr:MAG: hypothetical protein JSV12_04490 [Candidatus Bathyarchaeota archaeon]
MDKGKVFITICLVLVVSGVGAWLYIAPMNLEGSNNLESRVNDLESRVSEQLVIVGIPWGEQEISFMITHIGTAEATISEIRVDNKLNSSSPGWIGNRTLIPGQTGNITLYGLKYLANGFTEEESYQFRFITARGNSFYSVVWYGSYTMVTEQLEIQGATFNTGNANVTLSAQNTGTASLTVSRYKIGVSGTVTDLASSIAIAQGATASVTVPLTWTAGTTYDIYLVTSTDNQFPYRATAP